MRVSSAHEHLRRDGRWTGGRIPYGYQVAPNPNGAGRILVVNQEEAETVRKIVQRVLAKESLMAITTDLTHAEIPPPGHSSRRGTGKRSDSKRWYTTTLRSLLVSPQLLGQVIEDGQPILRTDGLPLVTRPPILDVDTWHALQDELKRRANPGERRREGTALLRGVVHCGLCGYRMYTFMAKGRTRYRCIGRLNKRQGGGSIDCYGVTIAAAAMEEHVVEKFTGRYGALPVTRLIEHAGEDFRPQIRQAQEALSDLEKDRYERGLFKGDEGAERFATQYGQLEERVASLKIKQRDAKPTGAEEVPTGQTYAELWQASDTAGRRDLLLNAGAYVEVAPATRLGKTLDTSRLAVYFGEEGHMRLCCGRWQGGHGRGRRARRGPVSRTRADEVPAVEVCSTSGASCCCGRRLYVSPYVSQAPTILRTGRRYDSERPSRVVNSTRSKTRSQSAFPVVAARAYRCVRLPRQSPMTWSRDGSDRGRSSPRDGR
ncbi:recombinase family protein [Streptomyces sp. NPDC006925]|uniref:recombinase family protein n=1 Tax=Streptomyces sp. NPDC006925 TaxID=3364768 RepID=UPI00369346AE